MKARWVGLGFVACAIAIVPACADGTLDAAVMDSLAMKPAFEEGCAACPPGFVCSGNACMDAAGDFDGDGVPAARDCDDRDARIRPGATEICNGKDDDCDGEIDEGFDRDGDGWVSCRGPRGGDCDDNDPLVNPGAVEVCNGKDDNCDGNIDESKDEDGDGYFACARLNQPADCDDRDPNVKPGGKEVCNGRDDDCNGKVDELPAHLSGSITSPVDPHWRLAGAATYTNGWVQLTPDEKYKAGAIWWNASYIFDAFELTATIWMPNRSDGADGLAFVFSPNTEVTRVGEAGHGFGAKGLGGFGVAIDTFTNTGEPPAPFLVMLDAQSGAHLARRVLPDIRDGREHKLRVTLKAGLVSAWVDGTNYFTDLPLYGYAPFVGHWGFTAATGEATATHWVRNIEMKFPNGQGCVP